jgi:endogenous inhibitor of DNA gyrase (YacG/DUF329 family)
MMKATCPICGRTRQGQSLAEWPEFPFCSPRCRTIDLGRWLGETYRLPADEAASEPPPQEPDAP